MKINFDENLIEAKFKKRYKRFFSELELETGEEITAHCPNTGSMKTCISEDIPALISKSDNPKRKLKFTLEATKPGRSWVGVNTHKPNKWVKYWAETGTIEEFKSFKEVKSEVKINPKTRIDLLLEKPGKKFFVEIKNVTLKTASDEVAFPDAVSERAKKHAEELAELIEPGVEAAIFFMINRNDCKRFRIASEIDPKYAESLKKAKKAGVKLIAYKTKFTKTGISLSEKIKVEL
jgi:sugar fermentation stimulation protein A